MPVEKDRLGGIKLKNCDTTDLFSRNLVNNPKKMRPRVRGGGLAQVRVAALVVAAAAAAHYQEEAETIAAVVRATKQMIRGGAVRKPGDGGGLGNGRGNACAAVAPAPRFQFGFFFFVSEEK